MKENTVVLDSNHINGINRIWYTLQESSGWLIFFSIWLLYIAVSFIQQRLIFTEDVIYNTFGEQLAYDRIEHLLEVRKELEWVGYAIIPVFIFFQVFFTAACLNIGYLLGEHQGLKIGFKHFFSLSVKSSIVYPLHSVVMLLVCLIFLNVQHMEDYSDADFFSLAGLLHLGRIKEWWVMPLRAINVFELFFCLALAAGISRGMKKSFRSGLAFVLLSYGVGFSLWMLFVMFLQLSLSA